MKKGFMLAELVIVLAIIGILTVVAIPNFQQAETRRNIARAKTGLRTVATALEAYAVDNSGKYPSDSGNGAGGGIYRAYANPPHTAADPAASFTIGYELTTPIAYVSSAAALRDPYRLAFVSTPVTTGRELFAFMNVELRQEKNPFSGGLATLRARVGTWILFSGGPDKFINNVPGGGDYSNVVNIPRLRNYDPTNGMISNGDIYRSHAHADGAPEIVSNL